MNSFAVVWKRKDWNLRCRAAETHQGSWKISLNYSSAFLRKGPIKNKMWGKREISLVGSGVYSWLFGWSGAALSTLCMEAECWRRNTCPCVVCAEEEELHLHVWPGRAMSMWWDCKMNTQPYAGWPGTAPTAGRATLYCSAQKVLQHWLDTALGVSFPKKASIWLQLGEEFSLLPLHSDVGLQLKSGF